MADESTWTDYLVTAGGGTAIHIFTDSLLTNFLKDQTIAGTSIALKDVAAVVLGKLGADRVGGAFGLALRGMAIIALYKIVEPFVKNLLQPAQASGGGGGGGGGGRQAAMMPAGGMPTAALPAPGASGVAALAQQYAATLSALRQQLGVVS